MENISKEVESNDIKIDKFFEVAKVIIYSIIGIVVFFIPVTIDNQTKTILHHITYKLQVNYRGLLQLCTIVYITIGVIKSTLSKHKSNLKKIYSSKEGKSNEASIYKNKLAEKYGKDDLGIPAIWYSGKITALSCPKDLFGEIVTKNVAEFDIEKGQVISRNFLDIAKTGTMEGPRRSRPTIKYSPIASTDGCWYSNLQYKLDLLEEFVNGNLKKHKTSTTKFGVDILLVTNKKGKTTGYLLSPNEIMNKENQALTEQLIKQISKLPRWSFGWLQTINGSIFQGRYVKANYSSDTGWKLEDYLH